MIGNLVMVGAGGAAGACLRYLSVQAAARWLGSGFPFGTLFVNVLGSLLMGVLAAVAMRFDDGRIARLAPFLLAGLLGGFTTFSAFSLDALLLVERGRIGLALLYVTGSVILSVGALALGLLLARSAMP